MKTRFLIIALLCVLTTAFAQNSTFVNKPKLVLLINIDELQTDHFLALRNKFGNYGFNRLIKEGTFYHNADYNIFSSYQGSKQTTLLTGTYPKDHGIIGAKWYARFEKKEQTPFQFTGDENKLQPDSGVVSQARIHCATITDELLLFSKNKSKVAAIGISPAQVVFNAGHKCNHIFWFNRSTGEMTSQADAELPEWANRFNSLKLADKYANRQWGPITDIRNYKEYEGDEDAEVRHFLYPLNNNTYLPYQRLTGSPFINTVLRDFTASLLINENYGQDDYTDFISLNLTCHPKVDGPSTQGLLSAEQEDMLLRLDNEMASLLKLIETQIGTEKVLVILTSTPTKRYSVEQLSKQGIKVGHFNGKKTSALLNLYLMALYGQGKWVMGYYSHQFYLNHDLIEQNKINKDEIVSKASEFLLDVAGIDNTITDKLLRNNEYTTGIFRDMQNSYLNGRSGDIFVDLAPGWIEENDHTSNASQSGNFSCNIPLLFWGYHTQREQIVRNINMIDVASTLAAIMQIPIPDGNIGEPLPEMVK